MNQEASSYLWRAGWGCLGGLLASAIITWLIPNQYQCQATVEFTPATLVPAFDPVAFDWCGVAPVKARLLADQLKILKGPELLRKANEQLARSCRVKVKLTSEKLGKLLVVRPLEGTDLVHLELTHSDLRFGCEMITEILNAYRDYRLCVEERNAAQYLYALKHARRQNQESADRRTICLKKIITAHPNLPVDYAKMGPSDLTQQFADIRRDIETFNEAIDSFNRMIKEHLEAREHLPDPLVIRQNPQFSSKPVSPNLAGNLVVGGVLGLIFGPIFRQKGK